MSERADLWADLNGRPANVRHQELCDLFELSGWTLMRTSGSHYLYKAPGQRPFPVPKHGGALQPRIVRNALALLRED